MSPIVSASDRDPLAPGLGASNSLFRPLSSRAAPEHGDPDCARSAVSCGDAETYRGPTFICFIAPGDSCRCCCCCNLGLLSFVICSISQTRGRYRFISIASLRESPSPSWTTSALPASVPDLPVALRDEYSAQAAAAAVGEKKSSTY